MDVWTIAPSEELLCVSNKTHCCLITGRFTRSLHSSRKSHRDSHFLVLLNLLWTSVSKAISLLVKTINVSLAERKGSMYWKVLYQFGAVRGFLWGEVGSAYSSHQSTEITGGETRSSQATEIWHSSNKTLIQILQWKVADSLEEWTREISWVCTLISERNCLFHIKFRNMT